MKYRILPKTGWKISAISYGCMSLSIGQGTNWRSDNERLLHQAVDLGINYFDTADMYDKGENEKLVGKALKAKRKELYIGTKVGNQWRADGSGWDWNPSKTYIMEAVEGSLKRLQTDYIDLYQLHGGTIDDPIDETIEAFELLKEQGKIREYGISSIRPNVIGTYVNCSNMVSVMMQYSILDRRPEESCLDLLREHDIGVIVRGAVAKGLLVDKPAREYLGYQDEEVERVANTVGTLTGKNHTPAQIALQFALKGPAVYSVAAGMRTREQLNENAATMDAESLSTAQYRQLSEVLAPNQYETHR